MRNTRARIIPRVIALTIALALLAAPGASAQTTTVPEPYPGTPTTVPGGPTAVDIDLGLVEVGGVLNVSQCNFAAGTVVRIVVNGVAIAPSVANSQGCIVVRIEVLPTLVALGSPLRPLAATGLAATADKVQVKFNGQTLTVGPYGTVVTVASTGTGTNGFSRTSTFRFTVVKRGTISRSGLVRTGTTVIKWTPFALGLVGIGYLLVLATRRRRSGAEA